MCICGTWARVPKDNFPPSDHHQDCGEFKPEVFARVEHDGTHCIMERHEAESMIAEGGDYTITQVMLTREQFERLPDFGGF